MVPELDLSDEPSSSARGRDEIMTEEELQAALFAELDADLEADLAQAQKESRSQRDETLANFDLSDLETGFGEPTDDELAARRRTSTRRGLARTMWTTCWLSSGWSPPPAGVRVGSQRAGPGGLRGCLRRGGVPSGEVKPREQVQDSDFVEIDKLLADADASSTEQEPYQGFSPGCGAGRFPRGAAGVQRL